jgi:glyoxylase-like metal-dependent hydrolase (beta-lactamase superfamily II)
VDGVVNTHLHVDHSGGNTRLEDSGFRPSPTRPVVIGIASFLFGDPARCVERAGLHVAEEIPQACCRRSG